MRTGELVDEARLSHPGLANDGRHLAMPLRGELLCAPELLQLIVAADEASEPTPRGRLQTGPHGSTPDHLEHLHRLAQSLDVDRAERLDLYEALGEPQRVGAHEDRARRRHLLHAHREMRGLPHRRVVHAQVAADRPHHDLPGIEANADLGEHALPTANFFGVPLQRLLHTERGIAGPHCVIFVRHRRPEQCHDPVAHHLVDGALVVVHRLHPGRVRTLGTELGGRRQ